MPSLPKTCARCPSTVRSERKSAAATSLFVLPSATRTATRSSAGVSAPGVAARPLIRLSSARAVGECRGTLEPARIALVPVEELARRFRSPELDQSLDGVDHESEPSGL